MSLTGLFSPLPGAFSLTRAAKTTTIAAEGGEEMKHVIFGESHGPAIGVTLSGVNQVVSEILEQAGFDSILHVSGCC
jgi:hypothetical protein